MSMKEEFTAIDMATAAADGFRAGQRAAQSAGVPDVSVMARVLSDRVADACNVDRADNWAMYGQEYIEDVQAMLAAAPTVKAERVCETGGTVSELLAAIMHFGSEKWAEGRGAADPELANVRAAWDSVYSLVQDLATRPEQTEQQATVKAEQVDMADAYVGAREDLAIWKRRALEAEQKVRHQEQIIDQLTLEDQGETRFGEPSLPTAGSADLTAVRCQCCATEYPHDSYDAGFIAGSGMCQVCDAAMPPKDLPAAGSAVEEVEVVAWRYRHSEQEKWQAGVERKSLWETEPLMTIAQHERIVAALSAQQSAQPEFCCKHSYKVAKQAAWGARELTQCKCDHNEYCDHCWPADFRPGGKWHGKFVAQQSAQDVSVDLGIKAAVNFIEKKAADYAMEQGHDDMGGLSFGSGPYAQIKADYHSGLLELADELRALLNGGEA